MGHLRKNGFTVKVEDVADITPVKRKYHVPAAVETCHTGLVDGYVVEGHVPADVIDRMLRERPKIAGVGVPGMPVGSPGMETPGYPPEHFQVLAFDAAGRTSVYASR